MDLTEGSPMHEQAGRSERSHYLRFPAPWLAGCSDTGLRHRTNQDALCLAVRGGEPNAAMLALADGVTTAHGSEVASAVATETAIEFMTQGHDRGYAANVVFMKAFAEANQAVLDASDDPSACTLIAAMVAGDTIAVGNVGDSRAYWVGADGSCQLLSTDDSMAQTRIMLGMPREQAEQSSQAHAITKWLGRQSMNASPSVTTLQPVGPGWLLLCSDGLWNYASSPDEMSALFARAAATSTPNDALAEALVAWAIERGGRDNITVIVARIDP